MNANNITNLVLLLVLAGGFGFGISWVLFHLKKKKMKENMLEDIENQEIIDFQVPEIINGKTIQTEVNLHDLAGIETEYDEEDESEEEDYEEEEEEDESEDEEDLDGLQDDFDNLGSEEDIEEAEEEVRPYVKGNGKDIEPGEESNDYVQKENKNDGKI